MQKALCDDFSGHVIAYQYLHYWFQRFETLGRILQRCSEKMQTQAYSRKEVGFPIQGSGGAKAVEKAGQGRLEEGVLGKKGPLSSGKKFQRCCHFGGLSSRWCEGQWWSVSREVALVGTRALFPPVVYTSPRPGAVPGEAPGVTGETSVAATFRVVSPGSLTLGFSNSVGDFEVLQILFGF